MVTAMGSRRIQRRTRRAGTGFTIVELMVTVAVAAILATIAVPSYQTVTRSVRVRTASSELVSDLVRARSEAIKRNADVMVVPEPLGWEAGWRIESAGGTLISSHGSVPGIRVTGAPASITYASNGRLALATATPPDFEIDVTDGASGYKRCTRVDLSGMPSTTIGGCS